MNGRQIVFTDVNKAELWNFELREPKDNEVIVKTAYSTISNGTEKANITGCPDVSIYSTETVAHFPRFLGYSSAGTVFKTGKNVKKFKIGDRVCSITGQHSSYNYFAEENLVKVDDNVSLQEASMAYISTFPMAALRKTKLEIGESALIMGLGILGAFAVMFAKAAGATPVIAVDPVESRRELAEKLGADYVLDPTTSDFADTVKKLTNGGANVCVEVTGLGIGLNQALDCMAKFGRVALLGCTRDSDFTVDYYRKVHGPGISLIGAHTLARPNTESSQGLWSHTDDEKTYLNLIKYGRINAKDLISEVHSPTEAPQVFYRLATDRNFPIGVQFDWEKVE